eukprot:TRINITY_DN1023_c0_g1_i3.p1 TRINITY_DN1023_c0_g1~~TRINITY_DN1023_c0_g1_i3.p1  ORF type:complete len:725 (-),score=58.86 TRINITY_DN1023_c0_g1_i3:5013-7187(-)
MDMIKIHHYQPRKEKMLTSTLLKRGMGIFSKKTLKYEKPILLLMGAPGVGKGTYGKRLSKDWNMPIFSTGEYLRGLLKTDKTELGNQLRALVQAGKLVGDEVIMKIMERRLFKDEDKKAKGIILDGFPRTVNQAELLDKIGTVQAAMNFYLRDDILVEKLAGRRECEKCHIPYNVATIKKEGYDMDPLMPKGDPNTCDACGGKLIQRTDDTEKVIRDRLVEYKNKTAPLEGYYKKKGVYIEFEPKRGVKDYPEIKQKLEDFLKTKQQQRIGLNLTISYYSAGDITYTFCTQQQQIQIKQLFKMNIRRSPNNIHRTHRNPDFTKVPPFTAKGKDLKTLVEYHSSYPHNTNLFGNIVLTTHTRTEPSIVRPSIPNTIKVQQKTQLMREYESRDTFGHIYGIKNPSNLAEPALVNDKYDCTIFDSEQLIEKAENAGSYFYESLKDPVKAATKTKTEPFIRNMLVRSEYDHQWSLHNQLIKTVKEKENMESIGNPLEIPGTLPFYSSKKKLLEGIKDVTYQQQQYIRACQHFISLYTIAQLCVQVQVKNHKTIQTHKWLAGLYKSFLTMACRDCTIDCISPVIRTAIFHTLKIVHSMWCLYYKFDRIQSLGLNVLRNHDISLINISSNIKTTLYSPELGSQQESLGLEVNISFLWLQKNQPHFFLAIPSLMTFSWSTVLSFPSAAFCLKSCGASTCEPQKDENFSSGFSSATDPPRPSLDKCKDNLKD